MCRIISGLQYRLEIHADLLQLLIKPMHKATDYRLYCKLIDNETGTELADDEIRQILAKQKAEARKPL